MRERLKRSGGDDKEDAEATSTPASRFTATSSRCKSPSSTPTTARAKFSSTYESFISLLSSDKDSTGNSDDDLQRAIERSLADDLRDQNDEEMGSSDVTSVLQEHFQLFPVGNIPELANKIKIRRRHIWGDALRAIRRPKFDSRQSVRIEFLGVAGIDDGGPRREFFDIALREMANDRTIFLGSENRLSFVHNVQALETRKYYYAGLFVGVSLGNGGPGFPCLAKPVFDFMRSGKASSVQIEVEDIPDVEIREKIQRVRSACSDIQLRDLLLDDGYTFIKECGYMKSIHTTSIADVPAIVRVVCIEYVLSRSMNEMAQFQEGLKALKLDSLIRLHPAALNHCPTSLTAEKLKSLMVPVYSPHGSNNRESEDAVMMNWLYFLDDVEANSVEIQLGQVLSFVTGSSTIPPMGFPNPVTIRFISGRGQNLPFASTCSLTQLPLALVDPDQLMVYAIADTVGFGQI